MNLTDEQIRVKVAELCGWKSITKSVLYEGEFIGSPPEMTPITRSRIPNYPEDLNAMAEARKYVKDEPRWTRELFAIVRQDVGFEKWDKMEADERAMALADATANQRARAFIATMEGKCSPPPTPQTK